MKKAKSQTTVFRWQTSAPSLRGAERPWRCWQEGLRCTRSRFMVSRSGRLTWLPRCWRCCRVCWGWARMSAGGATRLPCATSVRYRGPGSCHSWLAASWSSRPWQWPYSECNDSGPWSATRAHGAGVDSHGLGIDRQRRPSVAYAVAQGRGGAVGGLCRTVRGGHHPAASRPAKRAATQASTSRRSSLGSRLGHRLHARDGVGRTTAGCFLAAPSCSLHGSEVRTKPLRSALVAGSRPVVAPNAGCGSASP